MTDHKRLARLRGGDRTRQQSTELLRPIAGIEPGADVIIPETAAGLEPLCAVYSKNCLKSAEYNLRQHHLQIQQFFKKVQAKAIQQSLTQPLNR